MSFIAIVEQDALVALDVAKTLGRAGYEVAGPFADGRQCLDALRKGRPFDLILVDLDLEGGLSGAEVALRSRKDAGVPSVFIAALSDSRALDAAKDADPLGILVKPFSERELLGTTEIALFRAGMEKRLSYSEKRYRGLFDLSLSPRCVFDGEGRPVEANASFRRAFMAGGEGSAESLPDLESLFAEPKDWERVKSSTEDGRSILGEEFSMVDAAERRLSMLASFYGFREAESGKLMISAEFFDLTESHRLRDELLQAQKMEAMGRLAGGIAHDFNNILTAIVGHAEMLKMDVSPKDAAYEDVEGIARTAERATRLTRQLLSFSRKQPYSPKPIGIVSVVRDTSSILRKLVGETIHFSTMLPENDIVAFADPIQIEQVLINLIVNARDALERKSDGRIGLLVEKRSVERETAVGRFTLAPGSYVTIEVADNGVGIPENIRDKIFDPFFTTKEMGKGTGLGLAIVMSIAAQTNGAIGLRSEVGVGTTFTLWLPTASGKDELAGGAPEEEKARASQDLSLAGKPDILLVDDDESLLGFLSYILFKAGATVTSARNAGEALLRAERNEYDLVIADVNLPGLSGIELYERLAARKAMRFVFITGRIDLAAALPEGARLLEKPFTPWDLVDAIRAALKS